MTDNRDILKKLSQYISANPRETMFNVSSVTLIIYNLFKLFVPFIIDTSISFTRTRIPILMTEPHLVIDWALFYITYIITILLILINKQLKTILLQFLNYSTLFFFFSTWIMGGILWNHFPLFLIIFTLNLLSFREFNQNVPELINNKALIFTNIVGIVICLIHIYHLINILSLDNTIHFGASVQTFSNMIFLFGLMILKFENKGEIIVITSLYAIIIGLTTGLNYQESRSPNFLISLFLFLYGIIIIFLTPDPKLKKEISSKDATKV